MLDFRKIDVDAFDDEKITDVSEDLLLPCTSADDENASSKKSAAPPISNTECLATQRTEDEVKNWVEKTASDVRNALNKGDAVNAVKSAVGAGVPRGKEASALKVPPFFV